MADWHLKPVIITVPFSIPLWESVRLRHQSVRNRPISTVPSLIDNSLRCTVSNSTHDFVSDSCAVSPYIQHSSGPNTSITKLCRGLSWFRKTFALTYFSWTTYFLMAMRNVLGALVVVILMKHTLAYATGKLTNRDSGKHKVSWTCIYNPNRICISIVIYFREGRICNGPVDYHLYKFKQLVQQHTMDIYYILAVKYLSLSSSFSNFKKT